MWILDVRKSILKMPVLIKLVFMFLLLLFFARLQQGVEGFSKMCERIGSRVCVSA